MTDNSLIITIDWPWALGIIGTLLVLAWNGGSRIKEVETDVKWLKKALNKIEGQVSQLVINFGNEDKYFKTNSPVQLTPDGHRMLQDSGLKQYIDANTQELINKCTQAEDTNPYEVQQRIFAIFDDLPLEPDFENNLKRFAFDNGISIEVLRRIAAIYFRDIALEELNLDAEEINE